MNQIKNFTRKFTKGALKFLFYSVAIILILLSWIIIALQFPYVQTKVVNKATEYLSESLNYPIKVESVDIDWFDEIVLGGVSVEDPRKGTMIYLKEAVVDFEITSLYKAKFNIDEVTLRDGKVNMIRYAPDGMTNFTDFIDALREMSSPKVKNRKPVPFEVKKVTLDNMYFSYTDQRKPKLQDGFDHFHFSFDSIYADVSNLRVIADTFQINVAKLKTIEGKTKLRVHELNSLFTLTKRNMTFENLYAHIGESVVKDFLIFNYKSINDLSDFNNKVEVVAHLDESKVTFKNLSEFAPGLRPFKDKVTVSGFFQGYVTNFKAKDLSFAFGKSSLIKGKISFNGLPDFQETFIEFKFSKSKVHAADLRQYLDEQAYRVLNKFGDISGSGDFIGFPQDFVTKGSFNTNLGKVDSDMRLNAKSETGKPEYAGHLKTYAFNLGQLIDMPHKVQLIDMDGKINGSGFSLETAEATVDATITRLGINNYNYKNIKTNAKLSEKEFNGFISVKDTNLVFTANGKIDLTQNQEIVNVKANFQKANLKPLNLSNVQTLLKTDLELNFTGTNIDEIEGEALLKNTYLVYENDKEIMLDSLYARIKKEDDFNTVTIQSDLLSLNASGNFKFTTLSKDLERLYREYELNFINDKNSLNSYYANKANTPLEKYHLDFNVDVKNLNSLFEIYFPGLYLSRGLTVAGDFTHGNNSIVNISTHIDTLYYRENEIYNTNIELFTSKLTDSSNVLAMFFVNSSQQKIKGLPGTKNFYFEGIWDKRIINFSTDLFQENSSNSLNLKGDLAFLDNRKLLTLSNSNFTLLGKTWNISPNNKIYFTAKDFRFENFAVANRNQFISLNGRISNNESDIAELKISNFDLENINGLIMTNRLDGTVDGNVIIKDLFNNLDLHGDLMVKDFTMDGFLIGNVSGKSRWDNQKNQLNLDVKVSRSNMVTISLDGYIKPKVANKEEEINLTAHLDDADLEILSPLLVGIMSELSGKINGNLKVKGTFKDVTLEGKADVKKGKFKIDYLGTTYYFDDDIYLEENLIGFKNLKLRDEYGNTAIMDGGISHDGFRDFIVDMKGSLNQVNVLNTTEKDNELFYGTAFVTGNMEILGAFSNLTINANATSKKGTKIYIPLNTYEGLEQHSFIKFKSRKDSKKEEQKEEIDLSGIKLDFNFELTPDAYAEIIFDKRAGDIIRGYGNGNIKMTIDTRGDFNMYGSYRIASGKYNYTLANLISKEFTIQPNSSITWTGDPYGGLLDVSSYFENKVPIVPLLPFDDSLSRKQELGRTHPVKVILDIEGELLSPHIALDIDITPTTGIATEVATKFESDIKRNEQELNRQVFSLLVLGNFSPENSFSGISGSTSNVSQLLTNQLGNWLSQVDENLVIDIDLNGLDREALNTFNLRLSYTLLDGRLRISRDGSFTNFQNTQQQNLSNIAGEWTVEYLLSKDGKFRLKLYNKNNQNALLNTLNTGSYTSAGFSVLHTQSFNSINDLLGIKKKQNQAPQEPTEPKKSPEPAPTEVLPIKEEEEPKDTTRVE